ncbi:MAG: right-handed parallel beta-helix repeat-containing protein [Planctomycetota bacterium]|jgi:hypothetical protein
MVDKIYLKTTVAIVLLFILGAASANVHAKIIYVDDDAPGNNDGSSWNDAYNYLQDALAEAASGDEIRIAQGIYKPDHGYGFTLGDRDAAFHLINGVTLKAGYAGFGAPDTNARDVGLYETILDGDLKDDDAQTDDITNLPYDPTRNDNSYHVVVAGNTGGSAVLDGVTIVCGHANGTYENKTCYGGGIYNDSGSPTVTDCTFWRNTSVNGGAGMYNRSGDPNLTNCTFEQNASYDRGGGMFNYKADPTITECRFIGNLNTINSGAGIYNNRSNPTLTNCIFNGNTARWGFGGALGIYYINNIKLINCIFSGNSAFYGAGAINGSNGNYVGNTLTLINCTFAENSVDSTYGRGGGIHGSMYSLILNNCILWGNSDLDGTTETSQIHLYEGSNVIEYCCVQGWTGTLDPDGRGNISDYPNLINPAGADNIVGTEDDNLRLSAGSSCIDVGTNSTDPPLPLEDLDGEPRIQNGTVDMGAYEGTSAGFVLSTAYLDVPEGGSNTFTVALTQDPGADITVTIAKESGDTDITVSTAVLVFNSSNYSIPRAVTVEAADASDYLNGNALVSVSAAGFFTSYVTAAEQDDDSVPSVLHVDYRAQGNNSGADWANAFTELRDAMNVAFEYSDVEQIKVSQGTYKPAPPSGSSFESFVLVSGVIVQGGYAGLGAPIPNVRDLDAYETVLSADLKGDDVAGISDPSWDENSRHVLVGSNTDANTVLDGFTIKHGNASSSSHDRGGGMYNSSGDPTLINCRFIENFASRLGGGMFNYYDSSLTMNNCTFIGNSADNGGGAYLQGNAMVINCSFTANTSYQGGGAAHNSGAITFLNCIFSGNSNDEDDTGGGLNSGGGTQTLFNCTFSGNVGAIKIYDESHLIMQNCIVAYDRGQMYLEAENPVEIDYCCIPDWVIQDYGGTGNFDADPFLVDPDGDDDIFGTEDDDLRLLSYSPCIDAGDPNYVPGPEETDLDGNPRIRGDAVDMGAYEAGRTYHVNGANGNNTNDGLTPQTAFETIQRGINVAQDNDTVLVWPGVYNDEIAFWGDAITVKSAADAAVVETNYGYAFSFFSAEGPGTVLSNFVIRNSQFGIYLVNGASPTLRNLTIVNNDFGISAFNGADPDISNSIFWSNNSGDLFRESVPLMARYSCIEEGGEGEGNISLEPLFADANNGDYHLLSERGRYWPAYDVWVLGEVTSPCVDGGDPNVVPSNEPMPNGGRINMGAYGNTAYASMSEWPIKGDVNHDGRFNFVDVAILLDQWLAVLPWAQ